MTKARSIQQTAPKAIREGQKKSKTFAAAGACELFLAELRMRRRRLQQLLELVHLEADRMSAVPATVPARRKCTIARRKPAA